MGPKPWVPPEASRQVRWCCPGCIAKRLSGSCRLTFLSAGAASRGLRRKVVSAPGVDASNSGADAAPRTPQTWSKSSHFRSKSAQSWSKPPRTRPKIDSGPTSVDFGRSFGRLRTLFRHLGVHTRSPELRTSVCQCRPRSPQVWPNSDQSWPGSGHVLCNRLAATPSSTGRAVRPQYLTEARGSLNPRPVRRWYRDADPKPYPTERRLPNHPTVRTAGRGTARPPDRRPQRRMRLPPPLRCSLMPSSRREGGRTRARSPQGLRSARVSSRRGGRRRAAVRDARRAGAPRAWRADSAAASARRAPAPSPPRGAPQTPPR